MRIVHNKEKQNLFAFSISLDAKRGMIGIDLFKNSILIYLYERKEK